MTHRPLSGAILVSHGQPSDPVVGEAELSVLVDQVAQYLPDMPVLGATLAQDGALAAACEQAPEALVYPMFMADGWFTRTNLRRRLADHRGVQMSPFGTDPNLVDLAVRWIKAEASRPDCTVVVTAHGSGRSPYPALDTQIFVDRVSAHLPDMVFRSGFVEQAPFLTAALSGVDADALCVPFFAAKRGHVLEDLPEAVEQTGFQGRVLEPIGLHPDVPALIAQSVLSQITGA